MEIARRWRRAAPIAILLGATALLRPDWPCRAEIAVIEAYQAGVSDWMGRWVRCRFRPTCSHYAVSALRNQGFWRGNVHILKRLCLCSPIGWALSIKGDDPPPAPLPGGCASALRSPGNHGGRGNHGVEGRAAPKRAADFYFMP